MCREFIDDDSCFCDMCGKEVILCPSCNIPVTAKWCTRCGEQGIAAAGNQSFGSSATPVAPAPPVSAPQAAPTIVGQAAKPALRLRSRTLSLELDIADGAVLGRTATHSGAFASFGDVSGRHCSFSYHGGVGWSVTDVGSTNGTRYNGRPISPQAPQRLEDGSLLQIASIEFLVSIGSK